MMLYRPVNQAELDLIEASQWKKFPPRLPEQPIFYPVTNILYARQITKEWNVPAYQVGYVVGFEVMDTYLSQFETKNVGGENIDEYWIPSTQLDEFNAYIVGKIILLEKYVTT